MGGRQDEQVVSGARDEQDEQDEQVGGSTSVLCDIIAQQREFQVRQKSRRNSSLNYTGTSNNTSCLSNQDAQTRTTQWAATSGGGPGSNEAPFLSRRAGRAGRKFSLSYAISSLSPFSSPAASGASQQHHSGHDSARHRNSLASSAGDPPTSAPREELHSVAAASEHRGGAGSPEQESCLKKRGGLVHKAIRRGSKLLDSMLLSSGSSASADTPTADAPGDEPAFARPGGHADPAPSRPRRLRLGSIPQDLRRALSLGGPTHHHHHHHQQQPAREADSSLSAELQVGTSKSTPLQSHIPPPSGKVAQPELSEHKVAPSGVSCSSPARQPAAHLIGRLRRKNSLFTSPTGGLIQHHALLRVGRDKQVGQQQPREAASSSAASFSLCQDHSRTYKLIVFGSSAVGKTSLIQRFLYGHFPVTHKPTVEELHSNKYNIPELGEIYLEILDTSGTFEFPAMRRLSIEKGDAFILVYSASDLASWQEVQHLRQLILDEKQDDQSALPASSEPKQFPASLPPAGPAAQATGPPACHPAGRVRLQRGVATGGGHVGPVTTAATQLTAVLRRASCAAAAPLVSMGSAGFLGAGHSHSGSDNFIVSGRRTADSLSSGSSPEAGAQQQQLLQTAQRPSMAQYNSQLSRLLQFAPAANTTGKLLQSISIEEDQEPSLAGRMAGSSCSPAAAAAAAAAYQEQQVANQMDGKQRESSSSQAAQQQPLEARKKATRTPIVVVANKCDLDAISCQVDTEEAERIVCEQWGNSFVRCSAKEDLNVDRVFKELLKQARAPEILSQFVIDDHQQRRQSLPVLKNQLSAHHVRGLRSLYQQQLAAGSTSSQQETSKINSSADPAIRREQQQEVAAQRGGSIAAHTDADNQCALM